MTYTLRPIYQKPAFAFIDAHHRHHQRPPGWLFGTSAVDAEGETVGVIVAGRTVAKGHHDVTTVEFTRVCVRDGLERIKGHVNSVSSMLYAAAWRACREIGYRRGITYLLKDESGVTLRALAGQGWKFVRMVEGRSWDRKTRPRTDKHPTGDKQLWEVRA